MLRDAGATHVILGHSERRTDHAETDAAVRAKATSALAAGLIPMLQQANRFGWDMEPNVLQPIGENREGEPTSPRPRLLRAAIEEIERP